MVKIRGAQIEDGSISETELDAALAAKVNDAVVPDDLGGAAVLDVGTTAGTVAAGDRDYLAYAPVFNVRKYGAVGDGVTDDTAAFEAAEAALPTEGGVIYVPAGTYVVSYRIRRANVTLRGASWDAILKTPPGATTLNNDCPVRILADYVTVEDLQIDGNKANNGDIDDFTLGRQADGVGIYANYATVRNCWIHDTIGHKIIVWNEAFTDAGGASSLNAARTGALITGNLCTGVGQRAAIDIASTESPTGTTNYGCTVSNNRVRDMPIVFHTVFDSIIIGNEVQIAAKNQYGISVHTGSKRVSVIGNTVYQADTAISVYSASTACQDVLVTGNKVTDAASIGISVSLFDRVQVTDNVVSTAGVGISATNGTDIAIRSNLVSTTTTHGINVGGVLVRYGAIEGNEVVGATTAGIEAVIVQDITIRGNTLRTCANGINQWSASAARLAITGNRIRDITGTGIVCTAANSTVSDNDTEATADAIRLNANNITATGNRIGSATGIGIRIMSANTGIVLKANRIAGTTGAAISNLQADTIVRDNTGFVSTGADLLPVGTTAERPAAAAGLVRYNSTTSLPEFSSASAWTGLSPVGHAHDDDGVSIRGFWYEMDPASHGYLAWTHSPSLYMTNTVAAANGQCIATRLWVPRTISVTGIDVVQGNTALATPDAAEENVVALFTSAGTLIGKSADQAALWDDGTFAKRRAALAGGPFSITGGAGVFVYVAILANATTAPTFYAMNTNANLMNAGLSAGNFHSWMRSGVATIPTDAGWLLAAGVAHSINWWAGLY